MRFLFFTRVKQVASKESQSLVYWVFVYLLISQVFVRRRLL